MEINKSNDDQKVFTFLLNCDSLTYNDFETFLCNNNLPLLERWAFYFFGRKSWIGQDEINHMQKTNSPQYGPYINGKVYYWKEYLENKKAKIMDMIEILKEIIENYDITNIENTEDGIYLENRRGIMFIKCRENNKDYVSTCIFSNQLDYEIEIENLTELIEIVKLDKIEVTEKQVENIFLKNGWDYVYSQLDKDQENAIHRQNMEYFSEEENYSNYDDNDYCGACQSSPCMCSDREATSTTHDF